MQSDSSDEFLGLTQFNSCHMLDYKKKKRPAIEMLKQQNNVTTQITMMFTSLAKAGGRHACTSINKHVKVEFRNVEFLSK